MEAKKSPGSYRERHARSRDPPAGSLFAWASRSPIHRTQRWTSSFRLAASTRPTVTRAGFDSRITRPIGVWASTSVFRLTTRQRKGHQTAGLAGSRTLRPPADDGGSTGGRRRRAPPAQAVQHRTSGYVPPCRGNKGSFLRSIILRRASARAEGFSARSRDGNHDRDISRAPGAPRSCRYRPVGDDVRPLVWFLAHRVGDPIVCGMTERILTPFFELAR